jgi:hypothetical protein
MATAQFDPDLVRNLRAKLQELKNNREAVAQIKPKSFSYNELCQRKVLFPLKQNQSLPFLSSNYYLVKS